MNYCDEFGMDQAILSAIPKLMLVLILDTGKCQYPIMTIGVTSSFPPLIYIYIFLVSLFFIHGQNCPGSHAWERLRQNLSYKINQQVYSHFYSELEKICACIGKGIEENKLRNNFSFMIYFNLT